MGSKHTLMTVYVERVEQVTQNVMLWSADYGGKQPGNKTAVIDRITWIFHLANNRAVQDVNVKVLQVKLFVLLDFSIKVFAEPQTNDSWNIPS